MLFGRDAIEPARALGGKPGTSFAVWNRKPLECFELEPDDAEGIAGGDRLRLCAFEQIGFREAKDSGDLGAIVQISKDEVVLPHGGEDTTVRIGVRLETNRDRADVEQELEFAGSDERWMVEVQPACGAERGMTGKGQLFLRGEDAHAHTLGAIVLRIFRGQDEGGLRQIGFARDGLHLCIGKTAAVMEHSQRIAFERMLGKDIEDGVLQLAIHRVESTGRLTSLLQGTYFDDSRKWGQLLPCWRSTPAAVEIERRQPMLDTTTMSACSCCCNCCCCCGPRG